MGMSVTPDDQGLPLNLAGGRGTRIPDLRLLLAMHAARQATEPTARIVREAHLPVELSDEPDRLTLIFAASGSNPSILRRAAGPFNAAVAARLTMGNDGEGPVYPVS
jgi:hypothetical protein